MPSSERQKPVDDLVVGAGVAGALVAWKLAEQGRRVLVLEAGPLRAHRTELVGAYAGAVEKTPSAPYQGTPADDHAPTPKVTDVANGDGYFEQTGNEQFKSTYQRLVGGSTWHWLGNTPRLLPNDFRMHSTYGRAVDWPIGYDDLEPHYAEAERQLGVSGDAKEWNDVHGAYRSGPFPMPPIWRTYSDEVVARSIDGEIFGGEAIRMRITPQARNSVLYQGRPPCAGNSSCVPICPIAAKYDATVHVALAGSLPTPARFQYRSVVTKLIPDEHGRIVRAQYDEWSEDGATRERREVTCERVVVAAHAIETPMLLLRSGLCQDGPVGCYLMDHPQGYGGAILPDPVYGFRGPPVVSGIDAYRDGAFRSDRAAFRISLGNDGWGRMETLGSMVDAALFDRGLLGDELRAAVNERGTRMFRMSFSSEMLPERSNRVELGPQDDRGIARPRISFDLDDYNRATFEYATGVLGEMFDRLRATERRFSYPESRFSGAGHIMGSCRMGTSATNSVVDSVGRAHEHPNLYLVGAATFPTVGTANPTLTVAALSLRTVAAMIEELP